MENGDVEIWSKKRWKLRWAREREREIRRMEGRKQKRDRENNGQQVYENVH